MRCMSDKIYPRLERICIEKGTPLSYAHTLYTFTELMSQ